MICGGCKTEIELKGGESVKEIGGEWWHWICGVKAAHNLGEAELAAIAAAFEMSEEKLRKVVEECLLDPRKEGANKIAVPYLVSLISKDQIIDLFIHIREMAETE